MTNQNNELERILDEYENGQNPLQSEDYRINKAVKAIQALYAPKPVESGELRQAIQDLPEHLDKIMELVNKYNGTVDFTKTKVNLIDIASPNMTPEASKVVSDAIERSAEVMNKTKPVENGELREQVLTEFKQVHKLAPADYTENCTNVVMSIIQAHTNAAIANVLDRFEQDCRLHYTTWGNSEKMLQVSGVLKHIQAERAKLKEVK